MTTRFSANKKIHNQFSCYLHSLVLMSLFLTGLSLVASAGVSAPQQASRPARAAISQNVYGQPFYPVNTDSSPGGPKLLFAHCLVGTGEYGVTGYSDGSYPSVAQCKQSINEAMSKGFDGFMMNMFGNSPGPGHTSDLPSGPGSIQDHAMLNMLTAADQIDATNQNAWNNVGVRNFYIGWEPDFSSFPEDPVILADGVTRYSQHPSYYKFRGRPWFGTYAGEGGGYRTIKRVYGTAKKLLLAQNPPINPYFVPFFNIYGPNGENPPAQPAGTQQEVTSVLSGLADAAWMFNTGLGNATSPYNTAVPLAEDYSAQCHNVGMQWMASVSQQYFFSDGSGNRYFSETYGGEQLDHLWTSIIFRQKAYWTEFVTWNDFDEGTYVSSADINANWHDNGLRHGDSANYDAQFGETGNNNDGGYEGFYPSKDGLAAENLYWAQYWKMGSAPQIVNDNIFVTNRLQPAGATYNDPLGPMQPQGTENGSADPDDFFITTIEPQSTILTVTNTVGTAAPVVTFTLVVPAGLYHCRVPFTPGTPTFTLSRNGTTLVTLAGNPIQSAPKNGIYDPYYSSQTAHD